MKILIINSSPHKNGDTSYIVNKLCESDSVQADVVHTYFIDNNVFLMTKQTRYFIKLMIMKL